MSYINYECIYFEEIKEKRKEITRRYLFDAQSVSRIPRRLFLRPHVPHADPRAHRTTLRCQTYTSSRNSQGHSQIPPRVTRATPTPHPRSPGPPRLPPDHHRRFPRNQRRFQRKHGHLWDPLWILKNSPGDPQGSQELPETSSRTP